MKTEVVLDGLAFPEGPRWHEGRLWFSDMHAHRVLAMAPDGAVEEIVQVPEQPSGLGWLPDGRLLVVSMRDRKLLRLEPDGLAVHADLWDLATYHLNDMVVDDAGRAYVGNFGFDLDAQEQPREAEVLRVDPDGKARVAADGMRFPNGSVITPDGRTLIVGESFGACLTAFPIAADGSLGERRTWATLEGAVPDGICLDAEGAVWVASPVSNQVLRVHEGGAVSARIDVDQMAIACMLGGDDGRTLYVLTSATTHAEEAPRLLSGRIEAVRVEAPTPGSPEPGLSPRIRPILRRRGGPMKIDAGLMTTDLASVPERIRQLEAQGYDGVVTAETAHDPFLPLTLAAEHSEHIELQTSIAVAFARSPMILANIGHDLNQFSKGRFILGLGSQIKPHITKRFSMPWSHPAARMKEFIQAMRAIWACWHEGEPLRFKGEFYTHTPHGSVLQPRAGHPATGLRSVDAGRRSVPRMIRGGRRGGGPVAGTSTPAYNRKYVDEGRPSPPCDEGASTPPDASAHDQIEVTGTGFIVTGSDARAWEENRRATCKQIAFYGSTPAYRPVLEAHGWGDLQGELNAMSKRGEWDEMGERITDEILEQFAVVGQPKEIPGLLRARWGDTVDRVFAGLFGDEESRENAMQELRG